MKRYPLRVTKSPVSLKSLHKNCSCVRKDCLKVDKGSLKKKRLVELPADAECLYCDFCDVFKKIRNEKKNPDYVMYIYSKGYKAQWIVVETKISVKNEYGVAQIKKGLETMSERSEMFAVSPRPETLLGLLVHNRRKVRVSDYELSRKYTLKYGELVGKVQLCVYGANLGKYMIPSEG